MRFDDVVPVLERALEVLRAEARAMDQQIGAFTGAKASSAEAAPKKRGRKPKAVVAVAAPAEAPAKSRKRPVWSEEARRQAAERSRRMWEARRKADA